MNQYREMYYRDQKQILEPQHIINNSRLIKNFVKMLVIFLKILYMLTYLE